MTFDGDDTFTLSTGRTFYANNGIVGVSPEQLVAGSAKGWQFPFAEGYDGHEYADDWTPAERQELAAYMSALWLQWGNGQPYVAPDPVIAQRESVDRCVAATERIRATR